MMTRTVATLEISAIAFQEISDKVRARGYDHLFMADGSIDMYGIGIAPTPALPSNADQAPQADWAHRIVQRHANAARALEHMYTEKNIERLKEIGAELEAALAALPSDAAQAPIYERIPMDIAIDARRMRTLCRLLDTMDDMGNGFPGEVHAAFQDGGQRTRAALDAAATPDDLVQAAPVAPAATLIGWWDAEQPACIRWKEGYVRGDFADGVPVFIGAVAPAAAARPTWRPEGDPMTWTAGPHAFASQLDARAAFEAWAKPRSYDLTRCSPVPYAAYRSDFTNGALAGWFGAHGQPPLSTESVDMPVQSVAANAEDASRYRWLRRQAVAVRNYASGNPNWEIDYALRGESFDAAVDAARNGSQR